MKTIQHTQGKWELLRGGIEVQSETNEHEIFAYVGEHPVAIASVLPRLESEHDMPVSHYTMSEDEGLANAQLIAAAPETAAERDRLLAINAELLKTLREIARHIKDLDQDVRTRAEESILITCTAAIARAKGDA